MGDSQVSHGGAMEAAERIIQGPAGGDEASDRPLSTGLEEASCKRQAIDEGRWGGRSV